MSEAAGTVTPGLSGSDVGMLGLTPDRPSAHVVPPAGQVHAARLLALTPARLPAPMSASQVHAAVQLLGLTPLPALCPSGPGGDSHLCAIFPLTNSCRLPCVSQVHAARLLGRWRR